MFRVVRTVLGVGVAAVLLVAGLVAMGDADLDRWQA